MNRLVGYLAMGTMLGAAAGCDDGPTDPPDTSDLTVMTRNIYVGADIEAVLTASDPSRVPLLVAESFAAVQATDFEERAGALAKEIDEADPHLIGLQEVSLFRIRIAGDTLTGNGSGAQVVAFDYLALLLEALEARGLRYDVAARVENFDLEVPMATPSGLQGVRLTDSDVILARSDVHTSTARTGNFAHNLTVSLGGTAIEIRRGWAAVDATVDGRTYRFVNTHLEPADVDGGRVVPALELLQSAQATELLDGLLDAPHPVVLVGDLNSAADGSTTDTYGMALQAGFLDAWTLGGSGPGFTANQAPDLRNVESRLFHRIDYVLYRDGKIGPGRAFPGTVRADVVGEEPGDRTPSGLWPSDHAGVSVTFSFERE